MAKKNNTAIINGHYKIMLHGSLVKIKVMAESKGYLMVRRTSFYTFVISCKEFLKRVQP